MRHRMLLPVLALAAPLMVTACLPEGRPVEGRQLFAGRNVERPGFVGIDKVPYVLFQERTSTALPPRSAVYNLWIVNYETGEQRLLVQNVSAREAWRTQADGKGIRYLMVDEHFIEGGSSTGVSAPVGTLVRLDLTRGELERIPEVSTFQTNADGQFFYRTVAAGSRLPELHLRTSQGNDRSLGPSTGNVLVVSKDRVYFVSGEDKALCRILGPDEPVQVLHTKVNRFLLSSDEAWVVLQTTATDSGKSETVVQEVATGQERKLPGANPCCWQDFNGLEFAYSEAAQGATPGKLHAFNVKTGVDRVVTLPQGLQDVSGIIGRPMSDDSLFLDSLGRMALVSNEDPSAGRMLDIRPVSPTFSDDGRFLVYVDPQPDAMQEGQLMVQEGGFTQPPHPLSPPGSLVPPGGYFFIADGQRRILVFWAHFGRNASDLYFGNHETGEARVVAEGISEVTVTPRRVFGVVRVSEQDLTGELVNKDLIMNKETVLAHSVSESTVWGTRVAFVIRERIPTPNDGLWAIPIDGINGTSIGH
jgi:hypothetical protein